jgi:hypothetical protein
MEKHTESNGMSRVTEHTTQDPESDAKNPPRTSNAYPDDEAPGQLEVLNPKSHIPNPSADLPL